MANNGELEAAANEEVLIDLAQIAVELSAPLTFRLRNVEPVIRRVACES
jgi:hypothetical protein